MCPPVRKIAHQNPDDGMSLRGASASVDARATEVDHEGRVRTATHVSPVAESILRIYKYALPATLLARPAPTLAPPEADLSGSFPRTIAGSVPRLACPLAYARMVTGNRPYSATNDMDAPVRDRKILKRAAQPPSSRQVKNRSPVETRRSHLGRREGARLALRRVDAAPTARWPRGRNAAGCSPPRARGGGPLRVLRRV